MFAELLDAILAWVTANPRWAYLAVFLVAAGESLIVVGLVLPGAVLMFGFGALVAAGAIGLGPTLAWAAAGAIVGDGLSFWIGRHFHQRLRIVWPFNRHAALINRGVDFFHHHGVKSVVLARFIGPVRPIVPAVAGMLDMPPRRFFAANVGSALLWAPAYTLPGVVFGAALGLAAEVAGRLAALMVVLVALVWFGLWLVRLSYRIVQPRAGFLLARTLDWSRRHPLTQPLAAAVLDADHPEARGLATLLALLALSSALVAWLAGGWLAGLDLYVHAALQALRTPVADRLFMWVSGFGDGIVLSVVLGCGCTWLALRGRHNAALHWLAAALSAHALTALVNITGGARTQPQLLAAIGDTSADGRVSLAIAVCGFLAVLVARELAQPRRWIPYVCATLVTIPIAFSRLYLGLNGLSDVLAGAAMGLASVALFGIAYRRHSARPLGWPVLIAVVSATLVAAGAWRGERGFDAEPARATRAGEPTVIDAAHWWASAWQLLPAQRHDFRIRDRQPLNLQYAGDLAPLVEALGTHAWRTPTDLSAATALLLLSPQPSAAALPVLPQVHDGLHDVLRLLHDDGGDAAPYLLRLWPTHWRVGDEHARVWVGSVTRLELRRGLALFSYVATGAADAAGLALLHAALEPSCDTREDLRAASMHAVLLVRGCSGGEHAADAAAATPGQTGTEPARHKSTR
ncbi:MAG TPA: VTT domain-containing protein [Rhodocyclaceae bacterium]|nr:VTT domain-containing protein [Rhodocyclaceae bacterium]